MIIKKIMLTLILDSSKKLALPINFTMFKKKTKDDQKIKYNIEYAHIYADERFNQEHEKSVARLKQIFGELSLKPRDYTLSVLIDEYNPKKITMDINQFLEKLKSLNALPNFVGLESTLTTHKKDLLNALDKKTKNEYRRYIKQHQRIPCSFLTAIWHLQRLGAIKTTAGALKNIIPDGKPFTAQKIITILPKKYQDVETRAKEIILASKFKLYAEKMISVFFD